jgi:hypothetical protein
MVYKTPNYWVSGLCTSSGITNTKKHNGPPSTVGEWAIPSWFHPQRRENSNRTSQ